MAHLFFYIIVVLRRSGWLSFVLMSVVEGTPLTLEYDIIRDLASLKGSMYKVLGNKP